ncbi:MAG: metal ABC transporter permease [Planctomycetota bacterium]
MITYNTLIVLVGTSLLGASAGLVGSFAVLRRRSLTGDALAHAALPGLCLAFLVVGERSLPAMLFGAFLSGLAGIGCISALRRWTRIKEDTAIGIILSVFFGAGIVLSRCIQNMSATGSKAGLDSYILGKTAGMIFQDVLLIAGLATFCLVILLLFYKEFRVVAFDPSFARVQGWPAGSLDLLLMGLIAIAVVIGLPAVGVVLMASLLILPGASARFWTDELDRLLMLATFFGLITGAVGTLISTWYSLLPAGPIIVLTGTALFLLSLFFAPRRGALARWLLTRRVHLRLGQNKLLTLLHDLSEPSWPQPSAWSSDDFSRRKAWPPRQLKQLLRQNVARGLLEVVGDGQYRLTAEGWKNSAELARNQRMWELILTEHAEWSGCLANLEHTAVQECVPPEFYLQLDRELRERERYPKVLAQGQ